MNNRSSTGLSIGKTTVFKLFLLVGIIFISVVFIYYTFDVIAQLKDDAERMVTSYVKLWQLAASDNSSGGEVQVIFEEVIKKANFPVIIADKERRPVFWRNVSGIKDNDPSPEAREKVKKLSEKMKKEKGEIPLSYEGNVISYFYYGDSHVIKQLQWMPFVELGLVIAFVVVGLVGFHNIKRSEERHIWVGMAKEAAHQLGTPISSLMGWLELLSGRATDAGKGEEAEDLNKEEIFEQMKTDVARLQRVANRFGKIGSRPELTETNVNELLEETVAYFRRRLPFHGQGVDIMLDIGDVPSVSLNSELFTWAVENIIKNSLQAVDPQKGRIEIKSFRARDQKRVGIVIMDNGPGITKGTARKIFRPGFTSKKRGWGLGLTLARRIVEEYHRGRLSLVSSRPGETIFRIVLPIRDSDRVGRSWTRPFTDRNI